MKKILPLFLFILIGFISSSQVLPEWNDVYSQLAVKDWLLEKPLQKAAVYKDNQKNQLIFYNGLIRRTFALSPGFACFDFTNLGTHQQLIRAIQPEAKITINGIEYTVGGLKGQNEKAYLLPSWIQQFTSAADFQFQQINVADIKPRIQWKNTTWSTANRQETGKHVTLLFLSNDVLLKNIVVEVHYEIYDNLPLMVKWVEIKNQTDKTIAVNRIVNETLALVEEESAVVGSPEQMKKQHGIYVETNYAFNNAMRYDISDQTTHWITDSSYTSQVNYNYQTPCILEVFPEKVKAVELQPGERIASQRTHELLMDSYDRERRGMMIQRMYTSVAPWTTQNPIFMHLVSKNDNQVREAIDQCKATGYEALILSFGSHCNMEDTGANNIARWKMLADYAHQQGILIGSYSLFSSRRIDDETDVIDSKTGKPGGAFFGHAPCMGSKWGLAYIEKLKYFMKRTGFNLFENDGPYPGDVCASTSHPGHKNFDDSQWRQMELQKGLYKWCNENGIYVNAPDWYFLDGTHKIALGYREVNFSLSREQQKILNRQNIHDGTFEKLPSMGWGFVPLTKYQGGGAEAVLEPLSEHLSDYEILMMQYYGAGVQACYRGPRLYDTEETKQLVTKTIRWYKKYRDILNSSIVHLRRADGRDWDGFMHVNPSLHTKALVMVFNPTSSIMKRVIQVPLYYTGLNRAALVSEKDQHPKMYTPKQNLSIPLEITIPPNGYSWYVIRNK